MKEHLKRVASLALAVGMFFSVIPSSFIVSDMVNAAETSAEAEVHIWNGTTDVSWYDDEEMEFHISTPEQLAGLARLVNNGISMREKCIILDNDIYLNDTTTYDEWETNPPERTWISIGDSNGFSGTFDGGGNRTLFQNY